MKDPAAWAGIAVAAAIAVLADRAALWTGTTLLGFDKSPVSSIMLAIVIGLCVGNLLKLPTRWFAGIRFCSSVILKLGIILLGIRLSLFSAGQFTLVALPFVLAAISIALLTVGILGRYLRLTPQLTGLIAVGTAICGCTAIVATAPTIRANESEVSYAVACVTLFGLVAMFLYPLLAHVAFPAQPEFAGLVLGTSIHETAQVAGAGLMYEARYDAPVALDIATVTKLVRNLCMVAAIPLIGILYGSDRAEPGVPQRSWWQLVPWFIVGFAAMSAVRTVGDMSDRPFGLLSRDDWQALVAALQVAAESCLLLAMAAVGLASSLSGILRIGLRPLLLGFFAAALVGTVSFALIYFFAEPLLVALE